MPGLENVSPVVPDISAIVAKIAPIPSQVAFVPSNVAAFMAGGSVVAILHVPAHLTAVVADVPFIAADVPPVLSPINSVMAQVAACLCNVLPEGESRSKHRKAQQSKNSSSHVVLSFPGLLASGQELTQASCESCSYQAARVALVTSLVECKGLISGPAANNCTTISTAKLQQSAMNPAFRPR